MRRFKLFAIVATVASILAFAVPAGVEGQSPHRGINKLVCAADGGATCTLNSKGAKGSATLDTTLGGAASVYYLGYNESIYGALLSDVPRLSFTYTGTATVDPRFSVPIDTDGNGYTDFWAYIPAITCNNGSGLVDVINDSTCTIYVSTDATISYPNWAAFVAAYPTTYEVSLLDYYIIVIADSTVGGGVWTVSNVTVGRPGR